MLGLGRLGGSMLGLGIGRGLRRLCLCRLEGGLFRFFITFFCMGLGGLLLGYFYYKVIQLR